MLKERANEKKKEYQGRRRRQKKFLNPMDEKIQHVQKYHTGLLMMAKVLYSLSTFSAYTHIAVVKEKDMNKQR